MSNIFIIALYIIGAFVILLIPALVIAFIVSLITGKPFKQVIGIKSSQRKEEDKKYPLSTEEKVIAFIVGFMFGILGVLAVYLYYYANNKKIKGENLGSYAFYGFLTSLLSICGFVAFSSLIFT